MTANDLLTRARALVDAITPGEWRAYTSSTPNPGLIMGYTTISSTGTTLNVASVPGLRVQEVDPSFEQLAMLRKQSDAAFIAAAPTLVRDLAAELDATRAQVAELEAEVVQLRDQLAHIVEPPVTRPPLYVWYDEGEEPS